uniref:Uncharacterized protein n=1 Tax=viral metagenome TaxID=1070528 RepID=A0A6C0H8E8_9ZZZZ
MKKYFIKQQYEITSLDNKYKLMMETLNNKKKCINDVLDQINTINTNIENIDLDNTTQTYDLNKITYKAELLDKLYILKKEYELLKTDYNKLDYYNNTGDLILLYYDIRNNTTNYNKEKKNILDFMALNESDSNNKSDNKYLLLEKYCNRIEGIRLVHDEGFNRVNICDKCSIETVLDISESAYICPCCGHSESIIIDEDRQIKEYSPYKRLNHFREWLNQFQAKQTPDIPECVFIDIVKELNKNRITDLSILNRKNMKIILKKLQYNIYYEHIAYIINKLNNLPAPKITRDMEKIFISMFIQIQEPWDLYKPIGRKNFLSYSYVLYKLCELLELDHLLDCFTLLKDPDKIMENDLIWYKICKHLNWQYISSYK